jgi:hypothetical protein
VEERRDLTSSPSYVARAGERDYYKKQLATLKTFEEVEALCMPGEFDSDDPDACAAAENGEEKESEFAMKISNYANVLLLAFKVFD